MIKRLWKVKATIEVTYEVEYDGLGLGQSFKKQSTHTYPLDLLVMADSYIEAVDNFTYYAHNNRPSSTHWKDGHISAIQFEMVRVTKRAAYCRV